MERPAWKPNGFIVVPQMEFYSEFWLQVIYHFFWSWEANLTDWTTMCCLADILTVSYSREKLELELAWKCYYYSSCAYMLNLISETLTSFWWNMVLIWIFVSLNVTLQMYDRIISWEISSILSFANAAPVTKTGWDTLSDTGFAHLVQKSSP